MNRKHLLVATIVQGISFILAVSSYPLETATHRQINEYVARRTLDSFSLDSYLKSYLGIQQGVGFLVQGLIDNKQKSFQVWQWFGEGGVREDYSWARSANHFHNPLTDQGFSGVWGLGYKSGDSSVVWSQKPPGTQGPGGRYSWYDVRDYFYEALIAIDRVTKENKFAETFRGLGQLMHLVQDLSVPEHARNDGHYIGSLGLAVHYEQWVGNRKNVSIVSEPSNPMAGLFTVGNKPIQFTYYDSANINNPNPLAPVPVANLFDSNQYVLPIPGPSATLHSDIGLSEYTNANFLSPDTMFDPRFPFPMIDHCVLTVDSRNDRQYLSNRGPGEHVDHLAAAGWMYYWRAAGIPSGAVSNLPVHLDSFCYEEYASRLLPRAVGYSVGMLKYFFRGTLEISAPERFLYSIIDGSKIPQQFTRIKAKVRNISPLEKNDQGDVISYEEMGPGTLLAVAKHKKRTDYQPDLSNDPPTTESREPHFSYSISAPIDIASLDSETSTEFTFDFSNDPIPAGITDLYLQVIFRGTLGNEENVAIAVGMKDLMEPMHILSWNSTDRFYLYHQLYAPEEIKEKDELFNLLPPGFHLDPYDFETGAYFSSEVAASYNYHAYSLKLPPERFTRIIILTDTVPFHLFVGYYSQSPPMTDWFDKLVEEGVINQEDSKGSFEPQPAELFTFRGQKAHVFYTKTNFFPDDENINSAPWPSPSNPSPIETQVYP